MKLATGCQPLDALLGGGIEGGAITLVFGEAGTGKTNLCLQLARNAALHGEGKIAYVDTEGVSLERLSQISGKHAGKVLTSILFFSPHDLKEQERMVRNLAKISSPSLIVVDSINMYYRLALGDGSNHVGQALTTMMGELLRLTRRQEVPIVVTGQVYSAQDGHHAFGGRIMEHIVKTILLFERTAPGLRRATLLKHRSLPEGSATQFHLTQEGLSPPTPL